MTEKQVVKLIVAETLHDDIGRGVVRVEPSLFEKLGVSIGDYILIKGKGETIGRVQRCESSDYGLNLIRMDSSIRNNAGVSLGDEVEVKRVEVVEAKNVEISPTEEVKFTGDPTSIFKEKLVGKSVVKGNLLY